MSTEILRYAAFTDTPEGGNPAGVVLDASGLGDAEMQAIAADVGYSETAFVTAADGNDLVVRYFSPLAEVPFCGHATIATGVAWGDRHGDGLLALTTPAGLVEVTVADGVATLTSVEPSSAELDRRPVVHRTAPDRFRSRNPFPPGGVVEDPATGAAAAAFGAYLSELEGLGQAVLTLHQGEDMGRPGVLRVELREGDRRVRVSGAAVRIPDPAV